MNPQFSLDLGSDLRQLLQFPFMVHALQAGTIVAVMASLIGWFMVLRREAFAGHTLSIMSFPGASGAALLGLPLAFGYFAFCGASAVVIAAASRVGGRRDVAVGSAVVGTVQATAFALGFLFLSLYGGVLEDLESLLFGSVLGVSGGQVLTLLIVGLAALAFLAVTGRALLFASVDEDVARVHGVPVRTLHVAFLLMLGLTVAATAQIVGVLLVFALLVAPAATAQQLTSRMLPSLALTVLIALLVTWLSLALFYFTNQAEGFFLTSLALAAYASARGWRSLVRARSRSRVDPRPGRRGAVVAP